MRLSRLFGKTLKETPAEAETASHRLLVRAGMIAQLTAGVYSFMPLAFRSLKKIEAIVRDEMNRAGGQEVLLPILQPVEIWKETGREAAMGEALFHLKDRRQRELVLGPTHEEVVTGLATKNIQSYRDLPMMIYQIQTKFRDEPRPRAGLIRVREFIMKDAYSFDVDEEGLDKSYNAQMTAYRNIYARCGLPGMLVEADSGAIGGKGSHEFMLVTDTGEDELLFCADCGYAANVEKAECVKPDHAAESCLPLAEVATPGTKTIEQLSRFLQVPSDRTLKVVFYIAGEELIVSVIRGDLEINEVKLKNCLLAVNLRVATEEEVKQAGLIPGYASPIGGCRFRVIGDNSITGGANFIAGANKADTHLRNVNYPRDFKIDLLTDIARARPGDGCPRCPGKLKGARGVEVGHIFKLGTTYSAKLGATYADAGGIARPCVMGCYGIGVGRLLAAAVEQNHDDKGIIWPFPIAPYHVYLCALSMDNPEVAAAAEKVYGEMETRGVEVLFDDRMESPGVKFGDADLLGMPVRVTISPRTLKTQSAEIKLRNQKEFQITSLDGVIAKVQEIVAHGISERLKV
jgi:prolyl-tRNA synthetase